MFSNFKMLICDQCGASAVEYALIALFLSVAIIGVLIAVGDNLAQLFAEIRDAFDTQ